MVVKIDYDYKSDFDKVNLGIAERFVKFSKEFDVKCDPETIKMYIQWLEAKLLADFQHLIGKPHTAVYNDTIMERIKAKEQEIKNNKDYTDEERNDRLAKFDKHKQDMEMNIWTLENEEIGYLTNINYYAQIISYLNKLANGTEKSA